METVLLFLVIGLGLSAVAAILYMIAGAGKDFDYEWPDMDDDYKPNEDL